MKALFLLPLLFLASCQQPMAPDGFAMARGYTNVNSDFVADGTNSMPKQACGETGALYAFTASNGAGLICVYGNLKTVMIAETGLKP